MLAKHQWYIALVLVLSLLLAESLLAQPRLKKKIIEYGWDVPYPDFVRDNIREMEKRPFEGLIFRTKGFDHVFDVRPWNKADLQPQLDTLSQIQWQKFTTRIQEARQAVTIGVTGKYNPTIEAISPPHCPPAFTTISV